MRKGRILLTGFLLGSLLLNGCSRNSSLQVVVPKKEQESVLLNQGDESSVQEQVQAPVRYLCDKDFSNFRLLANARVIVPEVEGIQLKKIRSRNFSSEEMERMEKALMKGGAFYEIRQGFDYDTEIKETEIEEEYGYNASSQASLQKKEVGFTMGTGEAAAEVQEVPVGENVETFTEGSTYEELYSGQTEMVKPKPPDSYADAWKLLCDFLDGKKTFYFNTEDDFTTLQELLGETAEKESDWREQLMTQNLVMLCEELSWSTADGTNWERKELKDLAGRSEFLGFAMMCAPGRELLMRRRWEKCCFTGDAFLLECEPAPHEYEREYDRVVYKMLYQDIRRVEYDEGCKRLAVFGPHTVSRYYTRDGRPCADVFTEDSAPLCVFHYYAEFEEIKARLTYLAAPLRRTAFAP